MIVSRKVIKPTWRETPDGDMALERPGVLLLEFAQIKCLSRLCWNCYFMVS